jgi:hypothetical protein
MFSLLSYFIPYLSVPGKVGPWMLAEKYVLLCVYKSTYLLPSICCSMCWGREPLRRVCMVTMYQSRPRFRFY